MILPYIPLPTPPPTDMPPFQILPPTERLALLENMRERGISVLPTVTLDENPWTPQPGFDIAPPNIPQPGFDISPPTPPMEGFPIDEEPRSIVEGPSTEEEWMKKDPYITAEPKEGGGYIILKSLPCNRREELDGAILNLLK